MGLLFSQGGIILGSSEFNGCQYECVAKRLRRAVWRQPASAHRYDWDSSYFISGTALHDRKICIVYCTGKLKHAARRAVR